MSEEVKAGILAGERLNYRAIAKLAHDAGWKDEATLTAVMVCLAESGGWTGALNTANPDGSKDYGLMQINSVHLGQSGPGGQAVTEDLLYDPVYNMGFAHMLYKAAGYKWRPWAAYTNGSFLNYISAACQGVYNMWREKYDILP